MFEYYLDQFVTSNYAMPYLRWLVSLVIVAVNLRFELGLVHVRCVVC